MYTRKMKWLLLMVTALLVFTGCSLTNESPQQQKNSKDIRVQSYIGQGFKLDKGNKTTNIAKKHILEIKKAVQTYFIERYKTNVKVHNVVGAVDGASVFVESAGEPHFYTYAIVPIDVEKGKVHADRIWTQEGQVEGAIMDGIYGMIYEEEFETLDKYLEEFSNSYPVIGLREEAIENAVGNGFMTPYYYATIYDPSFQKLYELYIRDPKTTSETWKVEFNKSTHLAKDFIITIHLFMKEKDAKPDQEIFDKLKDDIQKMEGLPMGSYSLLLHDNTVNKTNGINSKDSTIELFKKDYIIKD